MLAHKETENTDIFENWPESYYEEEDLLKRKEYLEEQLKRHPDSVSDQRRMEILGKRLYLNRKESGDSFIRAWMMIRIGEQDKINFLNRRSKEKELRENLEALGVLNEETSDELRREWRDFARKYLIICCQSASYRSAGFGLLHLSDEKSALKIAREIDYVTRIIPARFGLEEACLPFRETVVQTYCDLLENGEEYWRKYNS